MAYIHPSYGDTPLSYVPKTSYKRGYGSLPRTRMPYKGNHTMLWYGKIKATKGKFVW